MRLHHVNLSLPVGGADAEAAFLIDVLGFRRLPSPEEFPAAQWFEDADGVQVHLSEDPDHHPSAFAHVAVEVGAALSDIETRLAANGHDAHSRDLFKMKVVFCQDPAGNRWELRGATV
jgi:catechol 2,3-dioxygenase-like lactoylglutathione lyase family enzyme